MLPKDLIINPLKSCYFKVINYSFFYCLGHAFKVYHPSFGLRQKMLNLIQNLSYYMMVEVSENFFPVKLTCLEYR
jgi:hypothetical protein